MFRFDLVRMTTRKPPCGQSPKPRCEWLFIGLSYWRAAGRFFFEVVVSSQRGGSASCRRPELWARRQPSKECCSPTWHSTYGSQRLLLLNESCRDLQGPATNDIESRLQLCRQPLAAFSIVSLRYRSHSLRLLSTKYAVLESLVYRMISRLGITGLSKYAAPRTRTHAHARTHTRTHARMHACGDKDVAVSRRYERTSTTHRREIATRCGISIPTPRRTGAGTVYMRVYTANAHAHALACMHESIYA